MKQLSSDEHKEFQEEFSHIKKDVRKVVIINIFFLVLLFGLFYLQQRTGFLANLEKLF